MKKDEFIKTALKCGYGCQKTVEKYTEGREEFTEDDFIRLFRLHTKFTSRSSKWRNYEGALTTKRLMNPGKD
jgi:hypothetical protein